MNYYTAFGDIHAKINFNLLGFALPSLAAPSIGDVVMGEGTANPYDMPLLGGAEFSPSVHGPNSAAHEWQLSAEIPIDASILPNIVGPSDTTLYGLEQATEIYHGNFGQNTSNVNVDDLFGTGPTPFDTEVKKVIDSSYGF